MSREDARASSAVRKVAARAVRRLNVLEWVILAVAAGLAMLAGALAAMVLESALGLAFRSTWIAASLVLFVVPALGAYLRARQLDRKEAKAAEERNRHGG